MAWMCFLYLILNVLPVFVQCTLVCSLSISFCTCSFCYICLFVYGALIYFVLCFVLCSSDTKHNFVYCRKKIITPHLHPYELHKITCVSKLSNYPILWKLINNNKIINTTYHYTLQKTLTLQEEGSAWKCDEWCSQANVF
jgi:hypothetical protein